MKNFFFKIYMLGFMVLVIFFIAIIWQVTFAHLFEEYHNRKQALEITKFKEQKKKEAEKTTFEKVILESEEKVKHYLGYKILEEKRIKGHFHHIGFQVGPDKRSYCVECHGDMPHDQLKDLRAFLNMHAFFVGCETCHVKPEGSQKVRVFKWYDRTTGDIVESPVKGSTPGTYRAKIISFERIGGKLERIDSEERIGFVREYREKEKSLTESQRSKAKKMIHKIVSKQPVMCEECHQKEASILPFEDLGYPKERIDSIISTEVVGMIKNYTKFYMPRMLHPGEAPAPAPAPQPEPVKKKGT
ncbi:MAG: cytochrome C [Nitrospirae bacterium]|nr:cytochrome C [Nitrospirota bacterium]